MCDDSSQWTSQSFCCWTLVSCTLLSGRNDVCPQNWLTEGYFPNDSGRSWPEMNDLLYFKWQADCFHSTLTPGSAAFTLFSGSGASVIKRGGGNRRCRFSLGLREAERNACFLQVEATVGLWSEAGQLRLQRSFSFWSSPNCTISVEASPILNSLSGGSLRTNTTAASIFLWWPYFPKCFTIILEEKQINTIEQSNILLLRNWTTVSFL